MKNKSKINTIFWTSKSKFLEIKKKQENFIENKFIVGYIDCLNDNKVHFISENKEIDIANLFLNESNLLDTIEELYLDERLDCSDVLIKNYINVFLSKGVLIYRLVDNNAIVKLSIEDFIKHSEHKFELGELVDKFNDECILVTGGAGSIGGELVKQLLLLSPSKIVILDQSECALNEMRLEINKQIFSIEVEYVLINITNLERLECLFKKNQFSLVFHAAAYKHVPMIELCPHEGVLTNILGTQYLAILSKKFNVRKFIFISTDKAVNPTSVMGMTKRIAELYLKSIFSEYPNFIIVRFGNVIGSSGSVVPMFKKQIENGEPVTITHPGVKRFFMTTNEACELVLHALLMGKSNETMYFEMGKPILIQDIAEQMGKLYSGFSNKDIVFEYIGLRPGEKLEEELFYKGAKIYRTNHEKIFICKERGINFDKLTDKINYILNNLNSFDTIELKHELKKIVQEYTISL